MVIVEGGRRSRPAWRIAASPRRPNHRATPVVNRRACGRHGSTMVNREPLRTSRRHRPVRHPRRRRQGQGAQGRRRAVIGFGAGEPDFPTPAHIVEAAVEACRDPKNHRYTPAGGLPELKEAIAAKTAARLRLRRRGPQVLVTNGGKHAVYAAFAALLRPRRRGDLPGAVLDHLSRADPLAGGVPVVVDTDDETGFKVTVDQLEAARTERTKVLCSCPRPTRPARSTRPTRSKAIGRVGARARHLGDHRRDLRAPHLRRPRVHLDARSLVPELADQCVVLNGVAKTYAMTGWRVGLDDRPRTTSSRRHQPPEPRHLERRQRQPARRARRRVRPARRRGR
jgi:hypothetical protein